MITTSDIQILCMLLIRIKPYKILDYRFVHTSTGQNKEEKDIALKEGEFDNHMAELEEARRNSDPMTVSEYIEHSMSSMEESFPKLYQENRVSLVITKKNLETLFRELLGKDDLSQVSVQELLDPIEKLPGNTNSEKWISFVTQSDFSKVNPAEVTKTVEQFNNEIGELTGTASKKVSKGIEIIDNQVIIDLNFWKAAYDKYSPVITENLDIINISGKVGLFGISNLLLYKALIRIYDKNNSIDLSKFNSDRAKLKVVQTLQTQNRLHFSTYGALVVMVGLNTMFFASKIIKAYQITIEAKTSSSISETPKNSILLLLGRKKNKFIFFHLLIFIILLVIIIGYPFVKAVLSYFNLILSSNLIYLKIFIAGMLNLTILYETTAIYLINKYSKLNELPLFCAKYTPKFIAKKLNSLYEISKFEDSDRQLILEVMHKGLISLLILDLFLIFFIFISILF